MTVHVGVSYVAVVTTSPIVASCASTYNTSGKYIITPNYPSNYGSNVDCNWKITSPIGTTITLTFDDFQTESSWDKLTIYDGPSPNLGYSWDRFSGIGPSDDFESTGNSLYLRFESDSTLVSRGFKLYYSWAGKNVNIEIF